jgi:cell division protein ZapA (FtsZ GTPase activity inhibitor)
MNDQLAAINIAIGDRTYRIKIHPSEEEMVRSTVKTINNKILEFKTNFAGKDMQDYIAMVLVWFATQTSAAGSTELNTEELMQTLQKMESQIDRLIE